MRASGYPVIAASTMLLPLQHAGIKVDVTCILDPGACMVFHFRNAVTDGVLVYLRGVVSEITRLWKGTVIARDDITGPSVFNMAVDVALNLGFDELHMVGADFCYAGDYSHAAGVVTAFKVDPRACIRRINGNGDEVLTDNDLITFHRALGRQVRGAAARFIQHGRSGLAVDGAEWATDAADGP